MSTVGPDIEAVVSQNRSSLEDWLVHTGFHDNDYRERELTRFRSLREVLRAVDQEAKQLQEDLLNLRLRHNQVYKEHADLEQREASLLARFDQLSKDRANAGAEPFAPITLPPLQFGVAEYLQEAPMEEGELPDTMNEQSEQYMKLDQSYRASPAPSNDPSVALSSGSRFLTSSQDGSDGSNGRRHDHEALDHNKSRDRSRSPDVIARPRTVRQGYRDRSNALPGTKHDSSPNDLEPDTVRDTRYFMLKSPRIENVYASQEDNLWACGVPLAEKLSEAFERCKDVILFFSANKSYGFQGYARMHTLPSSHNPEPSWYSGIRWNICEPFQVEWILTTSCSGDKMRGMRNKLVFDPLNTQGQLVTRSRDGDELDPRCGYNVKCILDREARNSAASAQG